MDSNQRHHICMWAFGSSSSMILVTRKTITRHLDDTVIKAPACSAVVGSRSSMGAVRPTVVVDVNHDMKLMKEETWSYSPLAALQRCE